jgi:hypothetical protein
MAGQSHTMPKTIRRIEQGVYRSLDDAIEIRQTDKGWTATVLEVPEGRAFAKGEVLTEKPLRTRGDVVKLLDEQKLLPPAPPNPAKAAEPKEQPQGEKSEVQPVPRPTGRKPRIRKPVKETVKASV